jgi:hypothetical protein
MFDSGLGGSAVGGMLARPYLYRCSWHGVACIKRESCDVRRRSLGEGLRMGRRVESRYSPPPEAGKIPEGRNGREQAIGPAGNLNAAHEDAISVEAAEQQQIVEFGRPK